MKLIRNDKKILIVGLGLLGGSYAKALKKQGFHVSAIARRRETVDYALSRGLIDEGAAEPDEKLIREADIAVFALYPHVFIEWVEKYGALFKKGAFLTDVTGVKGAVVYKIQELLPEGVEFIAAHPMAGKEVYGVENADDSIFHGANYIVVPTEKNTPEGIELCEDLGRVLGFRDVSRLSPSKHDEMIAFLSQLTHCIAVALMCASDEPSLVRYTGDSFRDLTRIARINDLMWSELFMDNREALLREMDSFKNAFSELYDTVKRGDVPRMREMMRISTERRARFDKKGD
ncbi:MAG: prephenate dehydrogenase [Clostridia bacterium]|nr:prephenate dehydrogenase [Clostridia bacterium]